MHIFYFLSPFLKFIVPCSLITLTALNNDEFCPKKYAAVSNKTDGMRGIKNRHKKPMVPP